jgi:hypothetical protein
MCAAAAAAAAAAVGLSQFTILFFICIGSYQALCNVVRVSRFNTNTLAAKVSPRKEHTCSVV